MTVGRFQLWPKRGNAVTGEVTAESSVVASQKG
jgi:hypothetical protein